MSLHALQSAPLFGALFLLFIYFLKQCGSEIPKLLIGADITFEDVFGEEFRLPYSKYRHWDNFHAFLFNRFWKNHGAQYVAPGRFQLYDYRGGSPTGGKRQRLKIPNLKVMMSVVIHVSEDNVCGRCVKHEWTSKSGIIPR
ncbi:hypothetical protein BBP40_008788 [Aspergillus hancockii]|nr:hypothetical protein BBP40_008788 [Aspergillus hancockii]